MDPCGSIYTWRHSDKYIAGSDVYIVMKFFNFNKSLFHHQKQLGFRNIEGYEDVKDIISRALESEDNFNLLLCGPPASSKTLFQNAIIEYEKDAVYFDGSNTTNRILDVLEEIEHLELN